MNYISPMMKRLKKLSSAFGPSGCEDEVREIIIDMLKKNFHRWEKDWMGNLYIFNTKAEHNRGGKRKVLLCAHMDEVGVVITGATDDGSLQFRPVGGIPPEIFPGNSLVFERNDIKGVIGFKPAHLQKNGKKKITLKELFVDIAEETKDKALHRVPLGTYGTFDTEFENLGKGFFKGKAFDDRVGCLVVIEALNKELTVDALFSVQEEIGLRGALVGARRFNPEYAIVLEGTAAGDTYRNEAEYPSLGKGPCITIMDRSVICDREMVETIRRTAEEYKIPYQWKRPLVGGTDAGRIHLANRGVKVAVISIPVRYIHSSAGIVKASDIRHTINLVEKVVKELL